MSSNNSHLINKVPELNSILDRIKEEMRIRGDTQRSLAAKIPCHAGQLSKALSGNTLPSANILIGISREGYDMNFILKGETSGLVNWSKEKELLEFHITRLEQMIENLMKK